MTLRRALSLPLVAALGLLAPRGARAEPAPPEVLGQADAHFKLGVQLFKQARYDAALAEFRKAHELVPDWHVLFNIGRSCDELHDAACAVDAFETYLRDAKDLSAERTADVQSALERLKPAVGTVEVASGEEQKVELRAPAPAPLAPPTPAVVPAPAKAAPPGANAVTPSKPGSRGPVWIGWAASGGFLAAGVTTGALALSARDDARDLASAGPELDAANRRMHRLALISDALSGAALATAAVSLYFTLRHPSPDTTAAQGISLSIAATHVRLRATF